MLLPALVLAITLLLPSKLSAQEVQAEAQARQRGLETTERFPEVSISDSFKGLSMLTNKVPVSMARVGVQTSQPLSLGLRDAIFRALKNNNEIEVARGDVRFQETQVDSLEGAYDAVFSANPLFSRNSITGSSPTKDLRISSGVSKAMRLGGGTYQVFFNNQRTENAFAQAQVSSGNVSSGGSAVYSSSFGLNFIQPLSRNLRIDSRRVNISIAKKRLDQTDSEFRTKALNTIAEVQRAYWDLVFALRNQQNQIANVNLARENLRQTEIRIDAGVAAPIAKAEVETELANREGELLLAAQQVTIAENALKRLIIGDPLSSEWYLSIVPVDKPFYSDSPVDLETSLRDAMENRFELRRLKLQREINDLEIDFLRDQTRPQVDVNTTFSIDGLSRSGSNAAVTSPLLTSQADLFLFNNLNATRSALSLPLIANPTVVIPPGPGFLFGGFGQSLRNMFRSDSPNFSVGVTFQLPFRNRTAKANLEGAKIQQSQLKAQMLAQEQAIIVDVRNAVQSVETARQRVLTARRARENAEIQLEGERRLYEAGRSTPFLLFQRENALTNARNAEIRAETDFNKSLAELQRVTATTFRANNIEVRSPLDDK
jgi:HAE1 family hydrophobic/amphiphilic exporter-1